MKSGFKRDDMTPKNGRDVVIIGSGPAGLAAAIKAKEAGVDGVLLVERGEQPGGLLHQCVHNGFGLFYFKEDLTGPEYAHRFIEKVKDLKINFLLETMVLNITREKKVTLCNKEGLVTLQPEAVVLAMGCRERSRQSTMVPGTRPAGVFTAGTAQRIVNVEGYLPGKEIVILGSGDVGMIMARRLTLEGAEVKAVVEILPYVGGLIRNEVQCLHDFKIPLFLEHTVTEVHGMQRVEAVTIAKVDKEGEPIPGTETKIECDTFLLSVGLIPENELSLMAGITLDPITGGPVVNEMMETNISGIFAAGNVVHVNDLVDNVTLEGEVAGQSAAEYAMGRVISTKRKINLKAGENIRYTIPHTIAGEKEVSLRMRVKEPKEKVTLKIGDILAKSLRVVKPSEIINVKLSTEQLGKIGQQATELLVSCEKRG
jgi:NADPH-dependent 2,4-dienoyl-CoA reductase/sulfur reductase-like enzyme